MVAVRHETARETDRDIRFVGGIHAEERAHAVKYELGSVLCRGSTGYSDLGGSNARAHIHTRAWCVAGL